MKHDPEFDIVVWGATGFTGQLTIEQLLRRVGVDVPDTRAWRLEQLRDSHPVVEALLHWRKAERIATTYGYRWLDEHVHDGDDFGLLQIRE